MKYVKGEKFVVKKWYSISNIEGKNCTYIGREKEEFGDEIYDVFLLDDPIIIHHEYEGGIEQEKIDKLYLSDNAYDEKYAIMEPRCEYYDLIEKEYKI